MSLSLKGAEPFYAEGNHIGCLLLHGLSSSPSEMGLLGRYLYDKGYTVSAPLLPGHGTSVEDMMKVSWQDWYAEVEMALSKLDGHCSRIYILGLSLGGLLALYTGSRKAAVAGVVSIAAPIHIGNPWAQYAPLLKHFVKTVDKEGPKLTVEGITRATYNQQSMHGVHELLKLRRLVRKSLPRMVKPVLIVQSKDDSVVLPSSAEYIHNRLKKSPIRILKWLSSSGHISTMGPEREEMFEQIDYFINNIIS